MRDVAKKWQQTTVLADCIYFSGINPRTTCDAFALTLGEKASLLKMPLSRNMAVPAIEPADDIRSGK